MKHLPLTFCLLLLLAVSGCDKLKTMMPQPATSATGTHADRVFGEWQVMTSSSAKDGLLCYAGATPFKSAGTATKHAQPYLMITRRESGKIEISVSSGYDYLQKSKLKLFVSGKKAYTLFFGDNVGWAKSDDDDKAILNALKTAKKVEVHGTAEEGGTSVDTYSPKGFEDALKRVRELCP